MLKLKTRTTGTDHFWASVARSNYLKTCQFISLILIRSSRNSYEIIDQPMIFNYATLQFKWFYKESILRHNLRKSGVYTTAFMQSDNKTLTRTSCKEIELGLSTSWNVYGKYETDMCCTDSAQRHCEDKQYDVFCWSKKLCRKNSVSPVWSKN